MRSEEEVARLERGMAQALGSPESRSDTSTMLTRDAVKKMVVLLRWVLGEDNSVVAMTAAYARIDSEAKP